MSTDGHDSGAKSEEDASLELDAERLRAWRLEHGVSRAQLAAMLDRSPHTIQAWEQGKRSVPQDIAPVLERAEKAAQVEARKWHDAFAARARDAPADMRLFTGAQLRALRLGLTLSRRELAGALGFSPRTIEDWEHDRRTIPRHLASAFRRVFDSTAADLAEVVDILRNPYET